MLFAQTLATTRARIDEAPGLDEIALAQFKYVNGVPFCRRHLLATFDPIQGPRLPIRRDPDFQEKLPAFGSNRASAFPCVFLSMSKRNFGCAR